MKKRGTALQGTIYQRESRHGRRIAVWWASYYREGRRHRVSLHTTDQAEARQKLSALVGGTAHEHEQQRRGERLTVGDLLDYLEGQQRVSAGHVAGWKHALGQKVAVEVTTADVRKVVARWQRVGVEWEGRTRQRLKPISNATANRWCATLRHAYRVGKQEFRVARLGDLVVPKYDETARYRTIRPAEMDAILKVVDDVVARDVFMLAGLTGMRLGQVKGTELSNVDLAQGVLEYRGEQTKSGKPQTIPLTAQTRTIIERALRRRVVGCALVFHHEGRKLGQLRTVWARACHRLGFVPGRRGYTPHGLRHSAISNLINAGVSTRVAMQISGHVTTNVFTRYGMVESEVMRSALEQAEAHHAAQVVAASKVRRLRRG